MIPFFSLSRIFNQRQDDASREKSQEFTRREIYASNQGYLCSRTTAKKRAVLLSHNQRTRRCASMTKQLNKRRRRRHLISPNEQHLVCINTFKWFVFFFPVLNRNTTKVTSFRSGDSALRLFNEQIKHQDRAKEKHREGGGERARRTTVEHRSEFKSIGQHV